MSTPGGAVPHDVRRAKIEKKSVQGPPVAARDKAALDPHDRKDGRPFPSAAASRRFGSLRLRKMGRRFGP